MRFITKKRVAAAVTAAIVAGGGMAAYAYFTGNSGSGTNQAHTGTATTWTVSVGTFAGGPMYPGSGTETATYTITNGNGGNQALTSVTASVPSGTGGAVLESGVAHAGCLAAWYSANAGAPASGLNTAIAKNASTTGSVTAQLTESNTNQDACKNVTPDVTVTAS